MFKIVNNGYAVNERHCGNHGYPNKHSSPHNHKIDWGDNHPDLSPPINYANDVPEFKDYRGNNMNVIKLNSNNFDSVDDFKNALLYGKEIVFKWDEIEYGIFYTTQNGDKFLLCESGKTDEQEFENVENLLDCQVQGKSLRDIITQIEVCLRMYSYSLEQQSTFQPHMTIKLIGVIIPPI